MRNKIQEKLQEARFREILERQEAMEKADREREDIALDAALNAEYMVCLLEESMGME